MQSKMFKKTWLLLILCPALLSACGTGENPAGSSELNDARTDQAIYPLGTAIKGGRNIELKHKNNMGWYATVARGSWIEVSQHRARAQMEFNNQYDFQISSIDFLLKGPNNILIASNSCTRGTGGEESDGRKNNNAVTLTCTNGKAVFYIYPKREDRIRIRHSEYQWEKGREVLKEITEFEIDTQE